MTQFKGFIVKIKNDYYSVKSLTKGLSHYHYELVELVKSDFVINYDPAFLNAKVAKELSNQMNALSKHLYGYHCVTLYGVNSDLTTMTII